MLSVVKLPTLWIWPTLGKPMLRSVMLAELLNFPNGETAEVLMARVLLAM